MACTPGTQLGRLRFHPALLPLKDRIADEAQKRGKSVNKTILEILDSYFKIQDTEEVKEKTR